MPLARKIERSNSKKLRQRETSRFSIGRATVRGWLSIARRRFDRANMNLVLTLVRDVEAVEVRCNDVVNSKSLHNAGKSGDIVRQAREQRTEFPGRMSFRRGASRTRVSHLVSSYSCLLNPTPNRIPTRNAKCDNGV